MAPKLSPHRKTEQHPFLLSVEEVARQLDTNIETGLNAAKVQEFQRNHPPNELEDGGGVSWHKILIKQLTNAMILVSKQTAPFPTKLTVQGPCICNVP